MKKIFQKISLTAILLSLLCPASSQAKTLTELQQDFIDLQFGMFIHYNIPTYAPDDWPDPDLPVSAFNPTRLDCDQWAKAALSANMSYGCLTTKHHSGFCIWDTKTTDYNVMNSPHGKDVVREYVDAFRANGLEVMLYYSILDTHHRIRPHLVTNEKTDMIKAQLRELLTNYGPIKAIIIDGWDAPWSRISYDEIPFGEIYNYIKSLQPDCLVMDLNAAKYPREALFYTDIKSYEQGAGQQISTTENKLPALACLSMQKNWFWKESFPTDTMKSAEYLVNENIIPYGKAYCNFILNVAPNRDGLIDANALAEMKKIGEMWSNKGRAATLPEKEYTPITQRNVAKFRPSESSWSWDYRLMDFANDDNFKTVWISNPLVKNPYWQVELGENVPVNMVTICEAGESALKSYNIEYRDGDTWKTVFSGNAPTASNVKIHRFDTVEADALRISFTESTGDIVITEFGVYTPNR